MAEMFNWAASEPLIQKMEMYTFKQNAIELKTITVFYEITTLVWTSNEKWIFIMEKGLTLTEAMQEWGAKWAKVSGL